MTARGSDGVVTAFVAVLAVALFAVAGLAVDAGRALAAREQAQAVAEEAARAGAEALSVDALHNGRVLLDPAAARLAAEQAMAAADAHGTVSADPDRVTVTVTASIPTTMLGIVGVRSMAVHATAAAVDVHGVTQGD